MASPVVCLVIADDPHGPLTLSRTAIVEATRVRYEGNLIGTTVEAQLETFKVHPGLGISSTSGRPFAFEWNVVTPEFGSDLLAGNEAHGIVGGQVGKGVLWHGSVSVTGQQKTQDASTGQGNSQR